MWRIPATYLALLFIGLAAAPAGGFPGAGDAVEAAEAPAGESHPHGPSEDELYFFEQQEVAVEDFPASGYILDVGGGGEGVIGRLKGTQVVAIDISRRELEDAPAGPLKIVMDATDLQFLDETFNTATAFFTLMYVPGSDHPKVFEEIARVLRPGGRFLIWDVELPERLDAEKDVAVFPLLIKLPGEEIATGYGTRWPARQQDAGYYIGLAEASGFEVLRKQASGGTLFLELRKRSG